MILSNYLNSIGLCFNLVGTGLLFKFGLPADIRRTGATHRITSEVNTAEAATARWYDRVSQWALVLLFAGFALQLWSNMVAPSSDTLRVREVAVVDERGVVRARLGGNLPDAVSRSGQPVPRGDKVAGLLIYDDRGAERGGYVTFEKSGIAALTLDSRGPQVAIFAADSSPGNGAGLRVWTGKSWAELKADSGGPHFSAGRDGRVVFLEPSATESEQGAFCRELKAEVAQMPVQPSGEEILAACRAHRTEKECHLCLGKP